ncbi:MAG: ABC transporter ATP-binding protein [Acidobacteriota bacterium]
MIEAINLTKSFQNLVALDSLNLKIEAGEIYCLLGANGAGKSTTINIFLNFIEPTSGTALIKGIDVTRSPLEARRILGYIPESVMLYRNLTGLENLRYFTALANRQDYAEAELRELLIEVGLPPEAASRRLSTYSKGMRQKVGIAIALARRAEAHFLDEPTSGLDPKASNEFSTLITRLRDRGMAILMATHDLFRAKESGTRVGIMKSGHLVAQINTGEFSHADLESIYLEHMH